MQNIVKLLDDTILVDCQIKITDYVYNTVEVVSKIVSTKRKTSLQVLVMRFLSDSVGIRTQDPQLRRLLLYPTELPNRSTMSSDFSERGCKDK